MSVLPAEFRDLERFEAWILETERERAAQRVASSIEAIREFYDTMKPQMEQVVAHLDKFPLDDMPAEANRLLLMSLSLMEVSNAVEMFGRPEAVEGFDSAKMVPIE